MSVRTEYDEQISNAKQHMHDAAQSLIKIVFEKCWGSDSQSSEKLARLREMTNTLLEYRDELSE